MKVCDVIKKRLQHFPVNIPEVLGTAFLRTISVVAFELSLVLEKNFKKKVRGEIAIALINLSQVQIQDPASASITTKEFVFLEKCAEFYCHKIFEAISR